MCNAAHLYRDGLHVGTVEVEGRVRISHNVRRSCRPRWCVLDTYCRMRYLQRLDYASENAYYMVRLPLRLATRLVKLYIQGNRKQEVQPSRRS